MIKLLIPKVPCADELMPALRKIDNSRTYTNFGPLVKTLEARLASFLGINFDMVTTVSSATSGLELAILSLNLPKGSKILVPSFSFFATATSILRCGHFPIFTDVERDTWVLTPKIAMQCLSNFKVDAVMPVAAFGYPLQIDLWDNFSNDTKLPVVIDAAGAFGNQRIGSKSLVVFSLHSTKALPAGEGGLVAGPKWWVDQIRTRSNFGIAQTSNENSYLQFIGSNAKLSEYHAAVCSTSFDTWYQQCKKRQYLHNEYVRLFSKNLPSISLQNRPIDGIYTIEPILLPKGVDASTIKEIMYKNGVETRRWYYPLLPVNIALSEFQQQETLQVARDISARLLGVPFHLFLDDKELITVVDVLSNAIKTYQ